MVRKQPLTQGSPSHVLRGPGCEHRCGLSVQHMGAGESSKERGRGPAATWGQWRPPLQIRVLMYMKCFHLLGMEAPKAQSPVTMASDMSVHTAGPKSRSLKTLFPDPCESLSCFPSAVSPSLEFHSTYTSCLLSFTRAQKDSKQEDKREERGAHR